jgi:hypothetical protein
MIDRTQHAMNVHISSYHLYRGLLWQFVMTGNRAGGHSQTTDLTPRALEWDSHWDPPV